MVSGVCTSSPTPSYLCIDLLINCFYKNDYLCMRVYRSGIMYSLILVSLTVNYSALALIWGGWQEGLQLCFPFLTISLFGNLLCFVHIQVNHRTVRVGRNIWRSSSPTLLLKHVPYSSFHRKASKWVLNISREGDSIASLMFIKTCSTKWIS